MANNIFNNFDIAYNSIANQNLTAANTLTIKVWNEIITTLKTQANVNAKYLTSLNKWLIGEGPVSIPGENSFVEYVTNFINNVPSIGYYASYNVNNDYELPTTKAVNKIAQDKASALDEDITNRLKTKADLVDGTVPLEQLDHAEVEEISIGKSTNYNLNSDGQVLTSKAINSIVNKKFNEAKDLIDNNTNKINTNKVNIENNTKSIQANTTYAQSLSQRITDTESTLKKKADLVDGKVPASQLPGYVDDVIEVNNYDDLPTPGESGKIYIVKSTNITYRWSGTQYTVIGKDLALGETPSTAFPGDRGKALELNTVKRTTENVSSTPLSQIKQLYGDTVAARVSDEYVLLVFGTTIENNTCSLTIYDKGSIKQFNNIWLNYTLGQVLHMGPNYMNSYTDTQIDKLISASPMSTYDLDLTEASWVRLAKVKDLTKNSSGQFIFDCYGMKANEEGTVLESIIGTTPKPNRKYEFEMDVTLRELYNRFNANMPFEIKLNTSHYSTKTALYFGADNTIVNNNKDTTSVPYIGARQPYKSLVQPIPTPIYVYINNDNGEYQIDTSRFIGVSPHPYISVKEEHFRLLIVGISYNQGPNGVIPIFTLYRNGIEILKNTEYIKYPTDLTADELAQFSVQIDNVNAEDIYRIEYQSEYEDGIIIDSITLNPVYDIDSTIFTVKGFIEGTDEYIQSVESTYPITKITEYDSHKEILTTSVFNVTCGLDDNGNLITDVLPITQSPELSGTDSSGGGSGGGSGGSGLTGTHGLASILLENYEGETYVCGLINFPNTGNYLGTYIEMKIENNLNFETLNRLEVVDIEEKTNNGEFQLLEGTKFESDFKYDFTLKTTLNKIKEHIDPYSTPGFEFTLSDSSSRKETILSFFRGSNIITVGSDKHEAPSVDINDLYSYFFAPSMRSQGGYTIENNTEIYNGVDALSYRVAPKMITTITKLSGTLTLQPYDSELTEVHVSWKGEEIVCPVVDGIATLEIDDVIKDNSYISVSEECFIGFYPDFNKDMDIVISINNVEISKDLELNFYEITGDFSVFGNSYKFHKTSDSYDLFSVYNKLDKIEKKLGETKENVSNISNKLISEFIEVDVSNYGLFYNINPYFVSSVVKHFYSNPHNINLNKTSRYCIFTYQGGSPHCDTMLGRVVAPTSMHIDFLDCILTTPYFELVLNGPYGEALDHPGLSIKCNKWYVQQGGSTFDVTDILKGVIILTTLDDTVMFNYNEGARYTLGQTTPALVCISSGAGGASKSFLVTYSYRYNGNELGANMLHATVVDVGSGTTYKWYLNFNNETYGDYDTIHRWVHSAFPDYTEVIESGINADDVLEIIEENAEQTSELDIGTSETFDGTSDNQIPTSKAVAEAVASAGGGKLYEHRISYIVSYNNASIFCRQQIINNYAEPYNSTTILDYLSIKSIGVCSPIEYYNNEIYTSPFLTNSSGVLRAKIEGLKISLAEDNTISIKGIESQGSVSQFEDVVTEL